MNTDYDGTKVQAFPLGEETFIGIATDEPCTRKIVHFSEDGTCTFTFRNGDKVVEGLAGFDVSVGKYCSGVTSTNEIMIG